MDPGAGVLDSSPATGRSNRVIAAITDSWDHPRTMVGVSIIIDWAARHGADAATLLRGSHIDAGTLADPHALIEAQQEIAVIRNLVTTFGDRPGLGVELGRLYHLTAYGYFGYLLASCASVREVTEKGLQYALLTFAFSTMAAHVGDHGHYVLAMEADDIPADVRRFVVERDVAATVQIQREIFPHPHRVPLREVRLTFGIDEARRPPVYWNYFRVPVSASRPRTEIVFDEAYLDQVPPMANPHTAQLMAAQCERIRAERLHRTGVAATVRAFLLDQSSLDLTLEEIAERLHYAPRTLRRHLEHEGTTFRAVLAEVRRSVAENLLRDPAVPKYEIARRLGYQEWSSLARARRRWQAGSPAAGR